MNLLRTGRPFYGEDHRGIRHDLQHLMRQLDGWFDNRDMPGMAELCKPTKAQLVKPVDKLADKPVKWGAHGDATMKEVTELIAQGWVGYIWMALPNRCGGGCKLDTGFCMETSRK